MDTNLPTLSARVCVVLLEEDQDMRVFFYSLLFSPFGVERGTRDTDKETIGSPSRRAQLMVHWCT